MNGERLLSAAELGQLLGFAAGTVVDWAERGAVPCFKVGGRLRFRLSEVEAWLEEQRHVASRDATGVSRREPQEVLR